ncbi:hypothetical protein KAH81_04980 [bacterium]|nr:hypothetical protein [bacterium]
MSIKIFKSKPENFPEKVALCGGNVLEKKLLMGAYRKRTEWVYDNLRIGIKINTAMDCGEAVGQITALPIYNSPIELKGDGLWYIPCIWMNPRAASPMLGEQLIASLVEDLQKSAKGIITLSSELWMNHRSFLERFGFVEVIKFKRIDSIVDVMGLSLDGSPMDVSLISPRSPEGIAPRLDMFYSSHCPVHTATAYRLSKEHKKLERQVQLVIHNTNDRSIIERYGYSFALLFNSQYDLLRPYLSGSSLEEVLEEYL